MTKKKSCYLNDHNFFIRSYSLPKKLTIKYSWFIFIFPGNIWRGHMFFYADQLRLMINIQLIIYYAKKACCRLNFIELWMIDQSSLRSKHLSWYSFSYVLILASSINIDFPGRSTSYHWSCLHYKSLVKPYLSEILLFVWNALNIFSLFTM